MDRLYKKNIPSEYVEKKIKDTKYEPAKERLKRWQELFNEYDGKESNFPERVKSIQFRDDKKANTKRQNEYIAKYSELVHDARDYKKKFEELVRSPLRAFRVDDKKQVERQLVDTLGQLQKLDNAIKELEKPKPNSVQEELNKKQDISSEYVKKKIKGTEHQPAKERLKTWKEVFDEYVGEKGVTKNNLDFREFVKSIKFLDNEENNTQ